ncbi:PH domain-containing protein [Streptomyces sp. NPDC091215]|uniref:PH domain-containing protein n=1 Tax=Streptomyces sp. NPDC091215 TaxID=3155192 RepID=UPI00342C4DE6
MDEDGVEREYRKRRKLPWSYLGLLGVVLLNAGLQTTRLFGDGGGGTGPWWVPLCFGVLMLVTLVLVLLALYRAYTRVTSAGITAQGPLRSRTWAWSEVYDIRVEQARRGSRQAAGPQWITFLYDFQGRRFQLPHLNDWQLDDPYAEVAELCLAAAPYRSLTWERHPDVEERILRTALRRKAQLWGCYGALVMAGVMFVVAMALVIAGWGEHFFLLVVCVPVASGVVLSAVLQRYWAARPPRSSARQP